MGFGVRIASDPLCILHICLRDRIVVLAYGIYIQEARTISADLARLNLIYCVGSFLELGKTKLAVTKSNCLN